MSAKNTPTAKDALYRAASGQGADMFDEGYALHPILRRAARSTPSRWRDAVVVAAHEDGLLELADLADGSIVRRWHHADLREELPVGTPVTVHSGYPVLAVGESLWSVRAA